MNTQNRAVVLGAGMAGLLAARALSGHFDEVVIAERDTVRGATAARRGVPQGRHAHALLARGQQVLEELFPGIHAEMTAAGIPSCDLSDDLRWYFLGRRLAQAPSGLLSVNATRPELEYHVRRRVEALPTVTFLEGVAVREPATDGGGSRVTGVRVADDENVVRTIEADLVVDATGRGSRILRWLDELGHPRPTEDRVGIDLAYTTRTYLLDSDPYGDDWSINSVASPRNPRGAFFGRHPGNIAQLSLTGLLGDHPPRHDEGFHAFTRSLDAPEIHRAIATAEPVDEAVTFRVPASVRRRFENLERFPEGLLVVGDAICAFNPVYGQGMTVAVLEAALLDEQLRRGPVDALAFYRTIAPVIDVPWEISVGSDLGFPGVQGPRPLAARVAGAYMTRLHTAAHLDGRLTAAFFRVAGLVDPLENLMRPARVLSVLRTARRVTSAEARVGRAAPVVAAARPQSVPSDRTDGTELDHAA